jgi:hypothetical protein
MFDEAAYYKTGKKKNGDLVEDKKTMNHSFIDDDRTQQTVDFVEKEKDNYAWDEHKNEWYIPAAQGMRRYQPDYPLKKYSKVRQWQ